MTYPVTYRAEFFSGRDAIKEFLKRKWAKELDYRLKKELWCFMDNRIAVRFEYEGYKNHVYRMINFCFNLKKCNEEEREKIIIAGAFPDIGIWVKDIVDYIPPSIPPAMEYLKRRNLEDWCTEIELMITEHHKITEYKDKTYPLVELFRKGDLVDFSFGLVKFGISDSYIKDVKAEFRNAGFHKNLGKRAGMWFVKHPLNPAPMMKW